MKFWKDVADPLRFQCFCLIVSCFVRKICAIKSRSRRKAEQNVKNSLTPNFFGRDDPDFSTAGCYHDLLSNVCQSLVEFCLLISVCEAWQWIRVQNLRRVGKNDGIILSHLWTKVHDMLRLCTRSLVVFNSFARLWISTISCFVWKS